SSTNSKSSTTSPTFTLSTVPGRCRVPSVATTVHAERSTRSAWVVTSVLLAYVAWFVVCLWVALARAAHFAGHLYVPYQGDAYTANADVWTGGWSWFAGPVTLTAQLHPLFAFASIGLAAWQLAQKRVRSTAIAYAGLLISTVLVLASLVAALTPAGRSITGWI